MTGRLSVCLASSTATVRSRHGVAQAVSASPEALAIRDQNFIKTFAIMGSSVSADAVIARKRCVVPSGLVLSSVPPTATASLDVAPSGTVVLKTCAMVESLWETTATQTMSVRVVSAPKTLNVERMSLI